MEKHLNSEIANHGLNYFENVNNHQKHVGTRWLIRQAKEKHPFIDWEMTTKLRQIIDEKNSHTEISSYECNDGILFDASLSMYYIKQKNIFFHSETGYYYDRNSNRFYDSNGNLLSLINGSKYKLAKEVIQHESDRVLYGRDVPGLIQNEGDISSAIQLNQLGYAHIEGWHKNRREPGLTKSNIIADESYNHMLQKAESVTFVAGKELVNEISQEESQIHLTRINITPETKLEALMARLTIIKGEYPTLYDLKVSFQRYPFELPEEYNILTMPVIDDDKKILALSGIPQSK